MVANSLLWCQSDCPPQEDLGDSSHCSELYPSPSCCKDCCEQSEGGTDLPPGTTAAQTWHKGGGCRISTSRCLDVCRWPWWEPLDREVKFQEHFQLCTGIRCCWLCVSWLQFCMRLSTLPIPHPHCFGMTMYFSLQREYNKDIRWVPSFSICPYTTSAPSWGQSSMYGTWMTSFVEGVLEDMWHDLEMFRVWGWNWACIWTVRSLRWSALILQQLVPFCQLSQVPRYWTHPVPPCWALLLEMPPLSCRSSMTRSPILSIMQAGNYKLF